MKRAQGKRCFSTVAIIVEEKNAKEITRKGVLQNQKRRIPCLHFSSFFFYHHLFSDPESSYSSDEVDVKCKRALCECDSQATKCFANSTFNAANIDYDTSKCWCINNEWKMVRYLNKKKVPYQRKILFYLCANWRTILKTEISFRKLYHFPTHPSLLIM